MYWNWDHRKKSGILMFIILIFLLNLYKLYFKLLLVATSGPLLNKLCVNSWNKVFCTQSFVNEVDKINLSELTFNDIAN